MTASGEVVRQPTAARRPEGGGGGKEEGTEVAERGAGSWSDPLLDFWLFFRVGGADPHVQASCLVVDAATGAGVETLRSNLPTQPSSTLRLVLVSDTHTRHRDLGRLPSGDVFIHAGDVLMSGRKWSVAGQLAKLRDFNDWLGTVDCNVKVVVAGNHDALAPELGTSRIQKALSHAVYLANQTFDGPRGWRCLAAPIARDAARIGHSRTARRVEPQRRWRKRWSKVPDPVRTSSSPMAPCMHWQGDSDPRLEEKDSYLGSYA